MDRTNKRPKPHPATLNTQHQQLASWSFWDFPERISVKVAGLSLQGRLDGFFRFRDVRKSAEPLISRLEVHGRV